MEGKDSSFQFQAAIRIAVDAQKAMLFINIAAAAVLIALSGHPADPRRVFSLSVACFGTAALACVIGLVFSYFAQLSFAGALLETERDNAARADIKRERYEIFSRLAISFVMLSIGVCLFSVWTAYVASTH